MDSIKRLIRIVTVDLNKRIRITGQEEISMSTIQKRLAGLSDTMETIITGSEPDFIHLGSDLQSIFSTVTRLSDIVIHSGKVSSDDAEEKILSQISGFARESVDKLKSCRNEIAENLTILDSEKSDLEQLAGLYSKQEKNFHAAECDCLEHCRGKQPDQAVQRYVYCFCPGNQAGFRKHEKHYLESV